MHDVARLSKADYILIYLLTYAGDHICIPLIRLFAIKLATYPKLTESS